MVLGAVDGSLFLLLVHGALAAFLAPIFPAVNHSLVLEKPREMFVLQKESPLTIQVWVYPTLKCGWSYRQGWPLEAAFPIFA